MKTVDIVVCGAVGSGKTTITAVVEKALKEEGFLVETFDQDGEEYFERVKEDLQHKVDVLRKNLLITIVQKSLNLEPHEEN